MLAQLASNLLPSNALAEFEALLTPKGGRDLNGGTGVTDDLKYNSMCFSSQKDPSIQISSSLSSYICIYLSISISLFSAKFSRQNGIHVSPTVMWDGLVANEVSSGWEQQDWINFFESKVVR